MRLRDCTGPAIKVAFEDVASDSPPFTHYGIGGGLDGYESAHACMMGWEYDPLTDDWDLEDIPREYPVIPEKATLLDVFGEDPEMA